jgi:hypothetical protein
MPLEVKKMVYAHMDKEELELFKPLIEAAMKGLEVKEGEREREERPNWKVDIEEGKEVRPWDKIAG